MKQPSSKKYDILFPVPAHKSFSEIDALLDSLNRALDKCNADAATREICRQVSKLLRKAILLYHIVELWEYNINRILDEGFKDNTLVGDKDFCHSAFLFISALFMRGNAFLRFGLTDDTFLSVFPQILTSDLHDDFVNMGIQSTSLPVKEAVTRLQRIKEMDKFVEKLNKYLTANNNPNKEMFQLVAMGTESLKGELDEMKDRTHALKDNSIFKVTKDRILQTIDEVELEWSSIRTDQIKKFLHVHDTRFRTLKRTLGGKWNVDLIGDDIVGDISCNKFTIIPATLKWDLVAQKGTVACNMMREVAQSNEVQRNNIRSKEDVHTASSSKQDVHTASTDKLKDRDNSGLTTALSPFSNKSSPVDTTTLTAGGDEYWSDDLQFDDTIVHAFEDPTLEPSPSSGFLDIGSFSQGSSPENTPRGLIIPTSTSVVASSIVQGTLETNKGEAVIMKNSYKYILNICKIVVEKEDKVAELLRHENCVAVFLEDFVNFHDANIEDSLWTVQKKLEEQIPPSATKTKKSIGKLCKSKVSLFALGIWKTIVKGWYKRSFNNITDKEELIEKLNLFFNSHLTTDQKFSEYLQTAVFFKSTNFSAVSFLNLSFCLRGLKSLFRGQYEDQGIIYGRSCEVLSEKYAIGKRQSPSIALELRTVARCLVGEFMIHHVKCPSKKNNKSSYDTYSKWKHFLEETLRVEIAEFDRESSVRKLGTKHTSSQPISTTQIPSQGSNDQKYSDEESEVDLHIGHDDEQSVETPYTPNPTGSNDDMSEETTGKVQQQETIESISPILGTEVSEISLNTAEVTITVNGEALKQTFTNTMTETELEMEFKTLIANIKQSIFSSRI